MNKNIIYTINKQTPRYDKKDYNGYGKVTIPIMQKYADGVGADLKVIDDKDVSKHSLTPHFDKFDIFKRFVNSDYENMLYMDLDIPSEIILLMILYQIPILYFLYLYMNKL